MTISSFYALSLGPIVLVVLLFATYKFHGSWNQGFSISLMIGLLGVSLGWAVGLLGTPKSDVERGLFRETYNLLSRKP